MATLVSTSNLFLRRVVATLTDAEVKALPTTPITIVPAPGSGYVLHPVLWIFRTDFSSGAYTNINASGYLDVEYSIANDLASGYIANDASTTPVLSRLTTFLGGADRHLTLYPFQENVSPESSEWGLFPLIHTGSDLDNGALRLVGHNGGSGNFTGGNAANSLRVTTYYVVEPV